METKHIQLRRAICGEDRSGRFHPMRMIHGCYDLRLQQLFVPQLSVAPDIVLKGIQRQATQKALAASTSRQRLAQHAGCATTENSGESIESALPEEISVSVVAGKEL